MADLKIVRTKDVTVNIDGLAVFVFIDKNTPITDSKGNPRKTGEIDEDNNDIYEYQPETITVEVTSATKKGIQDAEKAAIEIAKQRFAEKQGKHAKRLAVASAIIEAGLGTQATVFEGKYESVKGGA